MRSREACVASSDGEECCEDSSPLEERRQLIRPLAQVVMSRLGTLKEAAVAAIDYIDRTCDAFLEVDEEETEETTVDGAVAECGGDSEAALASMMLRGRRSPGMNHPDDEAGGLAPFVDRQLAKLHRLRSQRSAVDDDWV